MISRRGIAVALGRMLPVVGITTTVQAQDAPPSLTTISVLGDLQSTMVPETTERIRTAGYSRPGIGAAEYVRSPSGSPHRFRSADGGWWTLAPDQAVTPARFGALPGVNAAQPLQRAIDFIEQERGRGYLDLEGGRYLCEATLAMNPVRTGIRGSGAQLVFKGTMSPAILCRAQPNSQPYGHPVFAWEGFELAGPGPGGSMDGILFDTATPPLSSRILGIGLSIHGFRAGIRLGNRSYSIRFIGTDVYDCAVCFEAAKGTYETGENISFVSCSLFNSRLAVSNPAGAELFFYACSLDYCSRLYVGAGLTNFSSCHFEIAHPVARDEIPFELVEAGDVVIEGGTLMISGDDFEHGGVQAYMFLGRSRYSRFWLRNVAGWNWRTATGELMGGDGRMECSGLTGSANRQIPAVTKRSADHNLFGAAGGFEGPSISLNCWVTGGSRRIDRHTIVWENAGQEFGRAGLSIASQTVGADRHSVRLTRHGIGSGTESTFAFAAPIPPRATVGLEFTWRAQSKPGITGTATLYFQGIFASFAGTDISGIPIFTEHVAFGEADRSLTFSTEMPSFERIGFTTAYSDPTSTTDGYAPACATHVLLVVNPINLPADVDVFISSLQAYSL